MSENTLTATPAPARRSFWRFGQGSRTLGGWIVVVVGALLLADDVWEALGNFIGVNYQRLSLGLALTGWGWFFLTFAVLAPIILFFLAMFITRKMTAWRTLAIYLVTVMISAVIALDITLAAPYSLILG